MQVLKMRRRWLVILSLALIVVAVVLLTELYNRGPIDLRERYCLTGDDLPCRCFLHDEVLVEDIVPIVYGDMRVNSQYRKEFPNANSFALGGGDVNSWKTARILYCRTCRSAEHAWRQRRGRN